MTCEVVQKLPQLFTQNAERFSLETYLTNFAPRSVDELECICVRFLIMVIL